MAHQQEEGHQSCGNYRPPDEYSVVIEGILEDVNAGFLRWPFFDVFAGPESSVAAEPGAVIVGLESLDKVKHLSIDRFMIRILLRPDSGTFSEAFGKDFLLAREVVLVVGVVGKLQPKEGSVLGIVPFTFTGAEIGTHVCINGSFQFFVDGEDIILNLFNHALHEALDVVQIQIVVTEVFQLIISHVVQGQDEEGTEPIGSG